ncbi:Cro/CI family transcriptional regulator [Ectopseudomonas oleovorans]|uniref:Cro/CI family transcriptional regulator n=1 Tax=Ectopseudomonas oleovorans TaxID=301 RepID=UPI000A04B63F|nr:Cro/CI family transcriptional regulator [Pseudomonas oleovorans]
MEIKLHDYVAKHGQAKAADLLGVTPPSLHMALASGRDIRVVTRRGCVSAYEIRPFPSPAAKKRWEGRP